MRERKKKAKDELLSQAKIAERLEVSQATISRAIESLGLTPAKVDGKRRLYTAEQVDKIKEARKQGTTSSGKDTTKDQLEKLRQDYLDQLKAKDKQIDQLNEQLKMAQINLSQSQQLQLRQADQIKRLEAPQEATGDVVSPSNSQDTEESDEDTKTAHRTNEEITTVNGHTMRAAHITVNDKKPSKKHETLRQKLWEFLKS
ncbi:HTH domain-containing protein [Limosilactobacillus pontis]|uniref:HTH domain-containing protein n=1 Tax=Limosilactobacillus pontis TaxID=35787 RepID=UPI002F269497